MKKILSALTVTIPLVALGIQFQAAQVLLWYDSARIDDFPYQRTALYYTNKVALALNILALIIAVACVWSEWRKKKE